MIDLRRPPRAAVGRDEPGRRASLDSLAWSGGPGAAGGRQCLLHGLPVHAAPDTRAALAAARAGAGRDWLRNKWLAVVLLAIFLWAYEAFALWDSPWWTAWIALGYFAAAFVIDGFFSRCVLLQICLPDRPVQLRAVAGFAVGNPGARLRQLAIRAKPRTVSAGEKSIPGCELHLYQPRKSSNMDCTFCLDCIHACPHDNVGILAVPPGRALWNDPIRSGFGRFSKRPDLAALVVVLAFGAFVNAAGMVAPILEWRDRAASLARSGSPLLVTSISYVLGLVVLPALLVGGSAALCR